MSFQNNKVLGCDFSGQKAHISMIAGKAIPRAERQNEPTSEMNRPSRGTVIASTTIIKMILSVIVTITEETTYM